MRIPTLRGIIKRRILVNFRADAETVQGILPNGFRPKLYREKAIAGICLIRLEHIRPKHAPEFLGISSENAAHRIAVEWDEAGQTKEGVFIPRRDTNSAINAVAGGTLFPGEHNRAAFLITETESEINFSMKSCDEKVGVELRGTFSSELPVDSIFGSLDEASRFFEAGSLGYSVTKDQTRLDGITLQTKEWTVKPLTLDNVRSSFYEDKTIFPEGTITLDHALIMRNIKHEWHSAPEYELS